MKVLLALLFSSVFTSLTSVEGSDEAQNSRGIRRNDANAKSATKQNRLLSSTNYKLGGALILDEKQPAIPYKPYQTQTHTNSSDDVRNKKSLGAIVSCGSCCFGIEDATAYSNLSPSFYSKVIDMNGFVIASSSATSDAALYEAALTVAKMNKDRSDLLSILIEEGVHMTVIGKDELLTDVPEYSSYGSDWDWTRGVGATQWVPVTSCAEENLLCLGPQVDSYASENICIHETAHTLQGSGGKLPTQRFIEENGSEDLDNALRQQFINSVNGGLWSATYASVNHEEYWAEGVQTFYNANTEGPSGGDGIHNNINTRAELEEYDFGLYNIISRVFPLDASFVCPDFTCDCASFECPRVPTNSPTQSPTISPKTSPTKSPLPLPTTSPTQSPTSSPTTSPTKSPLPLPTTSPTQSPTSSTAAPAKSPTGCKEEEQHLMIKIKTDKKNKQIRFSVRERGTNGGWKKKILGRNKMKKNKLHKYNACIQLGNGCYRMRVTDKAGDGICCEKGKGHWSIIIDGKNIYRSKFENGKKDMKKFGNCKE